MRVVPERPFWTRIATVLGGFAIGPLLGVRLGMILAPESDVVQTVSGFSLALVFVGGMALWMGLGFVAAFVEFLGRLARGRLRDRGSPRPADRLVPPGYQSFVVLGLLLGSLAGLMAGLVTELSVVGAGLARCGLGLGYGLLLRAAAHHGYLPFPEPE